MEALSVKPKKKRRSSHTSRSRFILRLFRRQGYENEELDGFVACGKEIYLEGGIEVFLNWLRSPVNQSGSDELEELRLELFSLAWRHYETEQERSAQEKAAAAAQRKQELLQQAIEREEGKRAACRALGDCSRPQITRTPLTTEERMERSFEASLDALLEEVR